jgi:hypothetical protein
VILELLGKDTMARKTSGHKNKPISPLLKSFLSTPNQRRAYDEDTADQLHMWGDCCSGLHKSRTGSKICLFRGSDPEMVTSGASLIGCVFSTAVPPSGEIARAWCNLDPNRAASDEPRNMIMVGTCTFRLFEIANSLAHTPCNYVHSHR